MKLSIVIPAFNEEIYLPRTLAAGVAALEKTDFPDENTDKAA